MRKKFVLKLAIFSFISVLFSQSLSAQADTYGSDWKYLGYSALVPSLGQFKKDRPVYGSIALGGFVLLTANLAAAYQNFVSAEKDYRIKSVSYAGLSTELGVQGQFRAVDTVLIRMVLNNSAFAPYYAAKDNVNNAVMALGIFYIAQALNAYFLKPGGETALGSDEKSFLSGFDLKMSPERSVFGTGTNLQMSWSGRF